MKNNESLSKAPSGLEMVLGTSVMLFISTASLMLLFIEPLLQQFFGVQVNSSTAEANLVLLPAFVAGVIPPIIGLLGAVCQLCSDLRTGTSRKVWGNFLYQLGFGSSIFAALAGLAYALGMIAPFLQSPHFPFPAVMFAIVVFGAIMLATASLLERSKTLK